MSKKKRAVAIGATCLAVCLVAVSFTGMMPGGGPGEMQEETAQRTVVEVQNPTRGDITVSGSFVGTVEPGQQITIYPKAAGEVLTANFNVGDTVQAGDVLFQLDSSTLQLSIAQTQASLSSAEAKAQLNLEVAQQDLDTYEANVADGYNASLLQAETAVQSAENALLIANNNYRQARQDYNDYVNDKSDDDYSETKKESLRTARAQAELQVESAQIQLENAKASLEATKQAVENQKTTTENGVKSAELNTDFSAEYIGLQQQQKTLRDYTATAPISGIVEARNIDPYDMVSSGTAAYIISNKDVLTVTFNVAESALASMQIGDQLTIEKDGQTCIGVISEISTMANAQNGLYAIKASVEYAPFEMRSGSTVKLYVDTQKAEGGIIIPIDAVYYDNGTPYVYLFENNTARRVEIETGISNDTHIEVKSGITVNDQVVVTWSSSLYDGAEVFLPGTVPEDKNEDTVENTETVDEQVQDNSDSELMQQEEESIEEGDNSEGGEADAASSTESEEEAA